MKKLVVIMALAATLVGCGMQHEREKTVLFGKTYYTDELNARLEGLKAC